MPGTDFFNNPNLNRMNNTAAAAIAAVYAALMTSLPDHTGAGTEATGGGYARQLVTFGTPAGSTMACALEVDFGVPSGSQGIVGWWAFYNALTVGNMLWWEAAPSPFPLLVDATVQVIIPATTFALAFQNSLP